MRGGYAKEPVVIARQPVGLGLAPNRILGETEPNPADSLMMRGTPNLGLVTRRFFQKSACQKRLRCLSKASQLRVSIYTKGQLTRGAF